MGMELPGWLEKAAGFVGGQPWPEGDETALMRMAHGYMQAASTLSTAVDDVNTGATQVRSALEGDTADAMATAFKDLAQGDGGLEQLIEELNKLGSMCELTAIQISVTKSLIVAALAELVVEPAVDAATEWCTFGASTAVAVAEVAATRLAVRAALKQLVERIAASVAELTVKDVGMFVLKDVIGGGILGGAAKGAAVDLGWQFAANQTGIRHGYSLGEAGSAVENGAMTGLERLPGKLFGKHLYTELHGELPKPDLEGKNFAEGLAEKAQTGIENKIRTAPYTTIGGKISDHAFDQVIPEGRNDGQEEIKQQLTEKYVTPRTDAALDEARSLRDRVSE